MISVTRYAIVRGQDNEMFAAFVTPSNRVALDAGDDNQTKLLSLPFGSPAEASDRLSELVAALETVFGPVEWKDET